MVETYLATGWEFRCLTPSFALPQGGGNWTLARVPGHVHDDLVRAGVVADPFYRTNERECRWVDECDWEYRCRFDWSPKPGCPMRVLRFEGLDTVCAVFLNGEEVARHDNMFLPLEVDVTTLLRASNELRIVFSSAVRVANERRSAYLAREGIAPSLTTFYERSFVRKAQYMFGWDWGPRLVSCGIWKPVSLLEYDQRIGDVWVRPQLVDGEWLVDLAWEGGCVGELDKSDEWAEVVRSEEGFLQFRVREPILWWPNGQGRRKHGHEYLGAIELCGERTYYWFGLRTVELLREPDAWGESFEFLVNGERAFCKGANWIPRHSYPSLAQDYGVCPLTKAMREMNFNMVRVWGGGLYEDDEFYRQCDNEGIMVWQDFPFACAYYPEDDAFLASVEAEARANIRRLRNHPSLVLWCGNNECQQMHEQKWGGEASPPRCYGEKIYDDLLPRVLREEDPGRPYVHGSPSGKVEGRDCNMDGVGDSHYWDVWHGRGDWKHYEESTSRFCSEFGFASSPSLYTWSKCLDRETDWAFDSEAVRWHDKTLKGYEKYVSFIEMHYPKVETLEDLVYYSQLNQRDAMRCAIEHYRRSPFCAGTLVWQFNDCWPVQSWSLIDSSGVPKAALEDVSRLYRQTCCCIAREGDKLHVDFINSLDRVANVLNPQVVERGCPGLGHTLRGELPKGRLYGVMDSDGAVLDVPIVIHNDRAEPIGVTRVMTVETAGLDPVRNFFYMCDHLPNYPYVTRVQLLDEPKKIRMNIGRLTVGGLYDGETWVRSDVPVIDLVMWDEDRDRQQFGGWIPLLLPGVPGLVHFYDDYEPKRLVARSLAGYHEVEITRSPL